MHSTPRKGLIYEKAETKISTICIFTAVSGIVGNIYVRTDDICALD